MTPLASTLLDRRQHDARIITCYMHAGGPSSTAEWELPDLLAAAPSVAAGFTTKQGFVARLLREAIVTARLAPGQRLRQEDVSRQLGLSWTPVREAFRQLEAEGWVEIEHHRGAVVAPLRLADFEEIYLLRLVNEPLAARLSAEQISDASINAMAGLPKEMAALDLGRPAERVRFLQLEREFHEVLYRAADRPRLFELVMTLRYAAERYLRASFDIADEPLQHRRVHARLLAAARARDGAAAEATMRRALERVLNAVRPLLVRAFEEQRPGAGQRISAAADVDEAARTRNEPVLERQPHRGGPARTSGSVPRTRPSRR